MRKTYKLSIIIPYYNTKTYTDELLKVLEPQIREDIEVVVVDDGSAEPFTTDYEWCKVIHKKNGGVATARNLGMKRTKGKYISFLDSDDLVPDYFVDRILEKIKEKPYDVIDLSWKSLSSEGAQFNRVVSSDDKWLPNPSVCTRVFRRAFIGENKFNENKDTTED